MCQLQYIVSNISWMKSGGANVSTSCYLNPGLLYTMHTLWFILHHKRSKNALNATFELSKKLCYCVSKFYITITKSLTIQSQIFIRYVYIIKQGWAAGQCFFGIDTGYPGFFNRISHFTTIRPNSSFFSTQFILFKSTN